MLRTLSFETAKDYLTLCKPKVVLLMLITAWVGMQLAPNDIQLYQFCYGSLGIALCAGSAAIINHLLDRQIDSLMNRTALRPIASGRIQPEHAIVFSCLLGISGLVLLWHFVNNLTAILTFLSLIGYAIFYTAFLKRATPQNIVIGGAAGAMPPILGWAAISGDLSPYALLLALIIFTWTPPHFWALAIYRQQEYAKANIPMLPVTHGLRYTKLSILLYTILLFPVTILPFVVGMSGLLYALIASLFTSAFLIYAIKLYKTDDQKFALKTFNFSILYLLILFIALLLDHYLGLYLLQGA